MDEDKDKDQSRYKQRPDPERKRKDDEFQWKKASKTALIYILLSALVWVIITYSQDSTKVKFKK